MTQPIPDRPTVRAVVDAEQLRDAVLAMVNRYARSMFDCADTTLPYAERQLARRAATRRARCVVRLTFALAAVRQPGPGEDDGPRSRRRPRLRPQYRETAGRAS